MKVKVGRNIIPTAVILALLIAGIAGIWFTWSKRGPARGSQEYLQAALEDGETKQDLANGDCKEGTVDRLGAIDESAEATIVAKAYETRGLCLVYKEDLGGARDAYVKSAEFYDKAGDTAQADLLEGIVANLEQANSNDVSDMPDDAVEVGNEVNAQ